MNVSESTLSGFDLRDIYKDNGPWGYYTHPVLASKYHSVLYQLPAQKDRLPKPHYNAQCHWDDDHVLMPYSEKNLFPTKNENNEDVLKSRWELIQTSLLRPINSSAELEKAISLYNSNLPKLMALHCFFNEVLEEEESTHFFTTLLPEIINLALRLPDIVPSSIPLLKQGFQRSLSLSQLQVSCLLANAFLCTFPWKKETAASYPGINFIRLYAAHLRPKRRSAIAEKLKCICHYFRRVLFKAPTGVITFERKHLHKSEIPRWDNLDNTLGDTRLHVTSTGTIESEGLGMLQVDFANKYVGGGVLGSGCVQEEIRYVICPELIVGRLFVEQLGWNEALLCIGAEQYSYYSGYGDTFAWAGNCQDETPVDSSCRKMTSIVAIDACYFSKPSDQYNASAILRELNKAYTGFHSRYTSNLAPVATGNWGCGAFRGDSRLKSIIQLMACCASKRDLVYFTFGNEELRNEFYDIDNFLKQNNIAINQLWKYLCQFSKTNVTSSNLYPFIKQAHFDTKFQPTLKAFFGFTTHKNNASTSVTNTYKNESESIECNKHTKEAEDLNTALEIDFYDSDNVIESSQPEETFSATTFSSQKSVTCQKNVLNNLPKNHDTIIQIMNIIDSKTEDSESACCSSSTLISEFDACCKKIKTNEDCVDVECDNIMQMESETVSRMSKPDGFAPVVKKKITDYFVKLDQTK